MFRLMMILMNLRAAMTPKVVIPQPPLILLVMKVLQLIPQRVVTLHQIVTNHKVEMLEDK